MRTNNFQGYLAASSQKKGREAAGLSQRDLGHTQQSCQPFCLWVAGQTCPGLLWRPPSSGPSRQCRSVPFLLRGNSVRKLTFPPTPCLSAPLQEAPSEGKASSCLHLPSMGTVNAHHPAWLFLFVCFLCLWSFFPLGVYLLETGRWDFDFSVTGLQKSPPLGYMRDCSTGFPWGRGLEAAD